MVPTWNTPPPPCNPEMILFALPLIWKILLREPKYNTSMVFLVHMEGSRSRLAQLKNIWNMFLLYNFNVIFIFLLFQSGNNIAEEKPENRPEIDDRLEKLNIKWKELSDASKQKGTKLGDAQKQEEFNSGVKNIQEWFTEIEQTAVVHEKAVDLTTATRLYQKHKVMSLHDTAYLVLVMCSF